MSDLPSASAILTIDLAALRANWRLLADKVAPAECAAVVKADAYGIGLAPAVRALWAEGARTFFAARLAEGAAVRAVLPDATVYVLDGLTDDPAIFARGGVRPVIGSYGELERWVATPGTTDLPIAIHADTGMNRLGFAPADFAQLPALLRDVPVALVLSHFTSSETVGAVDNAKQVNIFRSVAGLAPRASLANSSGIFLGSKPWFDLVRPGYALYGGNPTPGRANPMHPVVLLEAPILQVRSVARGDTVGYNNGWTAERASRIATIALGYADGIPRGAAGTDAKPGPDVALGGHRCPIVGRISMDLITVDVSDIDAARCAPGARVEIVGPTIGIDEFGERAGTIGYEILTNLGARYERRYKGLPAEETR